MEKDFGIKHEKSFQLCKSYVHIYHQKLILPITDAHQQKKNLAVTLYYLKDTGSMWMIANTFGVHHCTVSNIIFQVCSAISDQLGPKYIKLPESEEEMLTKVSQCELKFRMIQAFGCIDGTHIHVQAVCDCCGIFMDIDCRWPGSSHDGNVFANTNITQMLRNGVIPRTSKTLLQDCDW